MQSIKNEAIILFHWKPSQVGVFLAPRTRSHDGLSGTLIGVETEITTRMTVLTFRKEEVRDCSYGRISNYG